MNYDETFQNYTTARNAESAEVTIGLIRNLLSPKSVVDFGCGQGAWLRAWYSHGTTDLLGVDGQHSAYETDLDGVVAILQKDLKQKIDLERRFDLAQSLEVAEHIPADAAETFVDNLVKHASIVLFSAAPPGQGGRGHVNEQPYEYWREKFAKRRYAMYDVVRPVLAAHREVQFYYRYNTFLYVRSDMAEMLPKEVASKLVYCEGSVPDISPLAFRIRKKFVKLLPRFIQDGLSRALSFGNRLAIRLREGNRI